MNNSTLWARHLTALVFSFGALAATSALADDTPVKTPKLLITSGAEPTPTKEVASSYTIVTAEDIATYQYRDIVALLQTVPGLHVTPYGGAGSLTSVFTRGAGSNQTLVMINGIPVNDPSSPAGAANLANIPLENVDRVEVVRGPQSALYGSQAIGGVINIITKTGSKEPVTTAKIEVGTLGTINTSASTGGSIGATDYFFSVSRDATDGNDVTPARLRGTQAEEKEGNERYAVSGRIGTTFNEHFKASTFIQYSKANTDIDDAGDDAFFTPVYENLNNQTKASRLLIGADLSGTFLDGRWRPKLSGNLTHLTSDAFDYAAGAGDSVYSYDLNYTGQTQSIAFDNAFDLTPSNRLTFGATYSHDEYKSSGYRDFTGGFVITPVSNAETSNSAVYLGDHMNFGERFFVTLSGRFDMPEDFDNRFSYTVAPAYYIAETDTRFTASYGTGFKAPSLYQLFGYDPNTFLNFYRGNPNLKPETSKGWDAGFEQGLFGGKVNLGATWFQTDIEDAISIVFVGFDSTAVNSDNLKTKGVETFVEYSPTDTITARIDYTYTQVNSSAFTTTMTRRPRHKIDFTGSWRPFEGTVLSTNLQWVDPQRDIPRDGFGFYVYPSPYTIVNIALSQKLTDNLTATLGVNNLLDQQYEPIHGLAAAGIEGLAGLAVTF